MKNDIEAMEKYLSIENPIFIYYKNKITNEELKRLKQMKNKYKIDRIKKCFEPAGESVGVKWKIELNCDNCGKIKETEVSKTWLLDYLYSEKNKKECFCDECDKKIREEKKKEYLEIEYKNRQVREDLRDYYINNWLNEECTLKQDWKKQIYKLKYEVSSYLYYFKPKELKEITDSMDYKNYLKTPYWKVTSEYARRLSQYKCQLCGGNDTLNVHHRTYEHKGTEINNTRDLIVLCKNCHCKFHDKFNN